MKYKLILWICAFFSFQFGEAKSENRTVTECLDCPNLMYMQGTSLMLKFPQVPSWASLTYLLPTYYFDGNNISYGPLDINVKNITTSTVLFEIKNFPPQALPVDGDFVFAGGAIKCKYDLVNEQTKLLGCEELDETCGCPVLDFASMNAELNFKPLAPNIPYPTTDDLDIVIKWGNNIIGPVTASYSYNSNSWIANLSDYPQNPCCNPYTGEIIINNDKVCVYKDHFLESCNNNPNPFSSDCEDIGECQEHLSDLIRNMPESGCPHFKSNCDESSFLYRTGKVEIGTALGPVGDGQQSTPNGLQSFSGWEHSDGYNQS